jgi:hypothetical protein
VFRDVSDDSGRAPDHGHGAGCLPHARQHLQVCHQVLLRRVQL